MTYQETIDYLYALQPPFHVVGSAAYKPGFDNILCLMRELDNPHERLRCVHVAGTNGKGSTSHLLAAVLQSAGYKVGLYTSPHLVDLRERIRINGCMISESDVIDFVGSHKMLLEKLKPSFFETMTAMAFDYFVRCGVDVAVVEVGLGGRLDSTNIITPDLSVITNIGYDHTEFLGNTLAAIAGEKAGIIKPHVSVVVGERNVETDGVFVAKATACDSKIVFAEGKCDILCELKGEYQEKNKTTVLTALTCLREVGYVISDDAIRYGFAHVCELTGLQGRWQVVSKNPLVVCDTGHNSHAFRYVAHQLKEFKSGRLFVVFGMVADKDVDKVMALLPHNAYYFFVNANTKRAIPANQLLALAQKNGLQGEAEDNVGEAFSRAKTMAQNNDMIFVGGSNYVVGDFLKNTIDFQDNAGQ